MRLLIVDTLYAPFLDEHYRTRPELHDAAYDEQWRALMDRHFGTADAYSHFLLPLGHQAHEVVANCRPLQDAWADEHGFRRRLLPPRRLPPHEELLVAQADELRADVVYLQNIGHLSPRALHRLGRRRLLVGQLASERPSGAHLEALDLLLTSFPHYLDTPGVPSEYFRIGFDPRVLERVVARPTREAAVFVGSLAPGQHDRGTAILERAARAAPIDFWGYGGEQVAAGSPIRDRYRGEAWGLEMYAVLAGSPVALNRHIDVAGQFANNMRLYEATGVGALLLTDAKRNLGELFEVGSEIVAYEGADDLAERIRHYLAHEDEAAAIAAAGQRRTLAEHTYEHRMRELAAILERHAA